MTIPVAEARPTMYRKPVRPKCAMDPTTTMQREVAETSGTTVGLVVLAALGVQLLQGPARAGAVVFLEAPVDQVGFPGDTTATTTPWPQLWEQPHLYPDPKPITGTFAPVFERDVLFSIDVKLSKSNLRRWNPEVSLQPSDLEPEDE